MPIGLNGDTLSGFYSSGSVAQIVTDTNNYQTSNSLFTFWEVNKSSGVIWETSITPKFANSKILVIYKISAGGLNGDYGAIKILGKVGSGSYNTIYNPQMVGNNQYSVEFGSSAPYGQFVLQVLPVLDTPSYTLGNTITYKIQASSYNGSSMTINQIRSGTGSNSGHSEVFIFEIMG